MLRQSVGSDNPLLELFLYHNRLQLATADVLYSDGHKYLPAVAVCKHFSHDLPEMKKVLALGCGLGSIVRVFATKGYMPHYTLVEKDSVVLKWALEFAAANTAPLIEPICDDAALFMQRNKAQYDLIFIDIFNGRVVPAFVFSESFLRLCSAALAVNGHLAFNYIINDKAEWMQVQAAFAAVFPGYTVIDRGVNQILVV